MDGRHRRRAAHRPVRAHPGRHRRRRRGAHGRTRRILNRRILNRRIPLGPGRFGRALARLADWIEPDEDPAAVIYGTITAGALLAVESTRRETLLEAGAAVLVTLLLLWLAHAYAAALGARLRSGRRQTGREWLRIARDEAALIKGALLPLGALVVARAAGASTHTAVVVALVAAAGLLVLLELLAGLRSRLSASELVVQVAFGAVLGIGVLVVKALVH